MLTKPLCQADVPYGGRRVDFHHCYNKPSIERDGKWYCKIHDPERVAARHKAQGEAWDAKWEAQREAEATRTHRLQTWELLREALQAAKDSFDLYWNEDDENDKVVMEMIEAALEAAREE